MNIFSSNKYELKLDVGDINDTILFCIYYLCMLKFIQFFLKINYFCKSRNFILFVIAFTTHCFICSIFTTNLYFDFPFITV